MTREEFYEVVVERLEGLLPNTSHVERRNDPPGGEPITVDGTPIPLELSQTATGRWRAKLEGDQFVWGRGGTQAVLDMVLPEIIKRLPRFHAQSDRDEKEIEGLRGALRSQRDGTEI